MCRNGYRRDTGSAKDWGDWLNHKAPRLSRPPCCLTIIVLDLNIIGEDLADEDVMNQVRGREAFPPMM